MCTGAMISVDTAINTAERYLHKNALWRKRSRVASALKSYRVYCFFTKPLTWLGFKQKGFKQYLKDWTPDLFDECIIMGWGSVSAARDVLRTAKLAKNNGSKEIFVSSSDWSMFNE